MTHETLVDRIAGSVRVTAQSASSVMTNSWSLAGMAFTLTGYDGRKWG